MSDSAPPPRRVPTLTEVVQIGTSAAPPPMPAIADAAPPGPGEALIIERVLASLQGQIEPAMAPALARAMERLQHETRLALMRTLHEQVAHAVAQAMAGAVQQAVGQTAGQAGGPAVAEPGPARIDGAAG